MKKIISVLLIVCFSVNLFAVDLSALSDENRLEYIKKSLTIDFSTITKSSLLGTSYYGVSVASGESEHKTVWTPYLGEQVLSKADFYRIVGENKLAINQEIIEEANRKNRIIANTLYGVGIGVMSIGLILELSILLDDDYSDAADKKMLPALGMVLGGGVIGLIGLPFELKSKQDQNISGQFAVGLADNYNIKLYTTLSK